MRMAAESTQTEHRTIESFLAGFFGAVAVVATAFAGYELGVVAAGSGADHPTLALMVGAAVVGAIGFRRVGGIESTGLARPW